LDRPSSPIDYLIRGLKKLKSEPPLNCQCRDLLNFLSAPPDEDASQWIDENFLTLGQRPIECLANRDDEVPPRNYPAPTVATYDNSPRTRLPVTLKTVLRKNQVKNVRKKPIWF
jgi:hypothetical protein